MEEGERKEVNLISEKRITGVKGFSGLKELFGAKEDEKLGGLVNVSILRHCQPASHDRNAPLSSEGIAEAEELARRMIIGPSAIIIYSPSLRAKETAEVLARNVPSRAVYLLEDRRLNKPSWNISERRLGRLVDRLKETRSARDQTRFLQMFYGASGEKAMAEEPARNLEYFLDDCEGLASVLPSGRRLNIIAISHQETMMSYLIRRGGLDLFGPRAWEGWRRLRGLKAGSGFNLLIDKRELTPKVLEIGGEQFSESE